MPRLVRRYALAMLVCSLLASFVMVVNPAHAALAATAGAPTISASPGTPQTGGAAAIGATVTVTGSGFGASETITLSLNGQSLTTTPNPLVTASDGSFSGTFMVPSLLQRTYPLVALGQSSGSHATLIFWLKATSENLSSPLSGNTTYQVTDTDPREPQMSYLRITNTSDANLVNPKVLPDSLPGQDPVLDISSLQSIVNGIFVANPNATTDAQKAFVIWQWLTDYTYHYYDAQNPNIQNQPDVIGLLNNYGYTRCFNHARMLADLFQTAGYATRTWNLNGHAVPEVYYGNAWHVYDADEEKYFVGSDGSTVLGEQSLTGNPYPIFLDTNPAGVAFHYTAPYMANMYATTSDNAPLGNVYPPSTHNMGITLRKNETLMEYWNNLGKYHDNYLHSPHPPVYTNGDVVYVPNLSQASYANGVYSSTNVSSYSQDSLHPNLHSQAPGTSSSVIYQVTSPYTLVGSLLNAQTYRATSSDALSIYFSLDGSNWGSPIYTQTKLGYDTPSLDLSNQLNNGTLAEAYQYYLKFQWTANSSANGAGIDGFNLDSQFEQAWEALPPLHSGTTNVTYSDQTGGPYPQGTVQIAYGWQPEPAAANFGGSSLAADYSSIPANGTTFANVTLTLKTSAKAAIPSMVVQLVPNAGANVQIQRTYQNQGLRGQTDNNGQATFEVRSTQVGSVTLTAADKNGTSLGLAPVTLNFTTPPAPPALTTSEGSAVVNGGFETGNLTGWTPGGVVSPTVESSTVYNGKYSAQLGAKSPSGTASNSWLVETLAIPTTAKSLNLEYWLANPQADSSNYFEVWVQDTAGDQVYQLSTTSTNTGGWKTLSLPYFNKYRGNTIQIYFNLHQDGSSNPAYAYLDTIQIS